MERIRIDLPEQIQFSCTLQVRVSDVNYGGHLGHDSLVSFLHEARNLLFRSLAVTELNVGGVGIILADLVVQYRSEAFNGDDLQIDCSVSNMKRSGLDIFYKVTNQSAQEIARAKTGIVFFDYSKRKTVSVPTAFLDRI